ncbi:MAG: sigma-E factor negative regulatory protein [Hydrogenophaga sp.]|nr:sigma-E factor negative regulatory protein [Hydrogenophaga sp.]
MNKHDHTGSSEAGMRPTDEGHLQRVSALVDGELAPDELEVLLHDEGAADHDWGADWATYHLIGEALRGGSATSAPLASTDFAAAVSRRLRDEGLAVPVQTHAVTLPARPSAANDAVFHWKLVAGLASLAAVAAVGWSLVGGAGPVASPTAGPQMALVSPPPQAADVPVVVQTAQGQMLRDTRLEQLLLEHRQYGGMSAFQTSTGFLRNATYDSGAQR